MKGKVVRVMLEKNFGFIRSDDGQDYFFHRTAIKNESSFNQRLIGRDVEFEDSSTEKGLRAEEVYFE